MRRCFYQTMNREEIQAVYDLGPDAVIALVEQLFAIIHAQQSQIASLTARVKELEDRLATNSHNSSKPPSSDAFNKQTKSLRQPSGKPSGGQVGHPGNTLLKVETPDHVILHPVAQCLSCGTQLGTLPAADYEARQVFDLPPLQLEVTEHRAEIKTCPGCGASNTAPFPPTLSKGVQYGEAIKGLAVYLMNYHLLPYRRTRELLIDLFGQAISEATLSQAAADCAQELSDSEALIKQGLQASEVAHFDETGFYVESQRQWLHVASTATLTHYASHPKRGAQAMDEIAILPVFAGRAIHDGLRSYFNYECDHGLCNAHHLRELRFIEERFGHQWAGKMSALLIDIKDQVAEAKASGRADLEAATISEFEQRYGEILRQGLALEATLPPPPTGQRGRQSQSKAKNLLDRLSVYQGETLAFMYDFRVPFDNNLAERDLRMMKVQQKISGCFRTADGATTFCRIRSYLSTMRKQGHNVFTVLKSVFAGHPIAPALPG